MTKEPRRALDTQAPKARYRVIRFDQIYRENDIEHRLTEPNHPSTNG
jgi:hypothetical protein